MKATQAQHIKHIANTIYECKACNIDLIEEKKCTLCGEKTQRAKVMHRVPLRKAY